MVSVSEYVATEGFLTALCRRDAIAAVIHYRRLPGERRALLWDPLEDCDLPPRVERAPLRAALDARDRRDEVGVRRAYLSASRLTRPVIERVLAYPSSAMTP